MTPATPSSRRSAQGSDRLFASTSYILGAGISIETMATTNTAGSAAINLTGNEFANALLGNAAANVLDGKGGADVMTGYAGDDTYYVDHAGDVVNEAAGGGSDRVLAAVEAAIDHGLNGIAYPADGAIAYARSRDVVVVAATVVVAMPVVSMVKVA